MESFEKITKWDVDSQIRGALVFVLLSISFFMIGSLGAKQTVSTANEKVAAQPSNPTDTGAPSQPTVNSRDEFIKYAKDIKLDEKKFTSCLDNPKVAESVQTDSQLAGKVGANGTPSFFINKKPIIGAQPIDVFKQALDAALSGSVPLTTPQPGEGSMLTDSQWAEVTKSPVGILGNVNAKVIMVDFTDFQCPFCQRAFQTTFPIIKKDYIDTGKIQYITRDLPLPFHRNAKVAAIAARCALEQNKYWEMHDKLFTNQNIWQ